MTDPQAAADLTAKQARWLAHTARTDADAYWAQVQQLRAELAALRQEARA